MKLRNGWLRGLRQQPTWGAHLSVRPFSILHTLRDLGTLAGRVLEISKGSGKQSLAVWARSSQAVFQPRTLLSSPTANGFKTSSAESRDTPSSDAPTIHPDTTIPLPEQLRSVMRLLPHSVVVCTALHDGTPRAMTMSSFTSLTLSPTPLVTFNIASPSRTLDAIAASRGFNIHVMAGDTRGALMADRFTRGNADHAVFEGLEWKDAAAPVLKGDGVMYVLRCRVLNDAPEGGLVRVRDHVIVVGEVVEMIPGQEGDGFGLAYADRRYRQIGDVIVKHEE